MYKNKQNTSYFKCMDIFTFKHSLCNTYQTMRKLKCSTNWSEIVKTKIFKIKTKITYISFERIISFFFNC